MSKVTFSLLLFFLTIGFGTIGYVVFEGMLPFEASCMTLITTFTFGFSQVRSWSDIGRDITIMG